MQSKPAAVEEFNEAIAIQQSLLKTSENHEMAMNSLAASYNNLASLQDVSDPTGAADAYQQAIALQLKLVKTDQVNRTYQAELARTYNNFGYLASRTKDWQRAEVCYSDAIQLQESLVKTSPKIISYRRDLAISYNNLGMVQSRINRFAEAELSFQKAVRLQVTLLATQPTDTQTLSNQGSVWNNLGMLHERLHRLAEAASAYQQAIHFQLLAMQKGTNNDAFRAILSRHYFNYARNLAVQGKFDEAMQVVMKRKELWPGQPERLFSVAQELAGFNHEMSGKSGVETTKIACQQAAVVALREALNEGLSPQRLKDASLSELSDSAEFRQLIEDPKLGLSAPLPARPAEISRVN